VRISVKFGAKKKAPDFFACYSIPFDFLRIPERGLHVNSVMVRFWIESPAESQGNLDMRIRLLPYAFFPNHTSILISQSRFALGEISLIHHYPIFFDSLCHLVS
jgi:hypothetical protein